MCGPMIKLWQWIKLWKWNIIISPSNMAKLTLFPFIHSFLFYLIGYIPSVPSQFSFIFIIIHASYPAFLIFIASGKSRSFIITFHHFTLYTSPSRNTDISLSFIITFHQSNSASASQSLSWSQSLNFIITISSNCQHHTRYPYNYVAFISLV